MALTIGKVFFGSLFDPFLEDHDNIVSIYFDKMMDEFLQNQIKDIENPIERMKYEQVIGLVGYFIKEAQRSNFRNHHYIMYNKEFLAKLKTNGLDDPDVKAFYIYKILNLEDIQSILIQIMEIIS